MLSGTGILVDFSYPEEAEEAITVYFVLALYSGPCTVESGFTVFDTADGSARTLLLTDLQEASEYRLIAGAVEGSDGFSLSSVILVSTLPTGKLKAHARE